MPSAAPAPPSAAADFAREVAIQFTHSDPAGIIYYPNYFDMIGDLIEEWLRSALGIDYTRAVLDDGVGLPIAGAEFQFRAPVKMGDRLTLELGVITVAADSVGLSIRGHSAGRQCLEGTVNCTMVQLATRGAIQIPVELRAKLETLRAHRTARA